MNNFWDRIKKAGIVASIFAILIFLIKVALKNAYIMSIAVSYTHLRAHET